MPGCQLRHERIEAIGRAIAKEEYDIVMLEEVSRADLTAYHPNQVWSDLVITT